MSSRSIPRLVPGARLGSHRAINLALVVNDGPIEPVPAAADTTAAAPAADESPSKPALASLPDRKPTLVPLRAPIWLSDMLVPERNSFGVLRLAMALAVLVSHAVFLVSGDHTAEPLYRWTGYTLGQHGVQVFFFLSGILVAQSLMKSESVRDYAVARALRIFPALTVCVLVTAVVIGPWLTTLPAAAYLKDKEVAAYIVKTLSLMTGSATLPGLFEASPGAAKGVVNSSLWTLKYEVLCYVALAAIGWIAIRTKAYRTVAAAAIAGWLALVASQRVGIELGSQKSALDIFRYFSLFFGAGAAAFVLRKWIPIHGLVLVPLAVIAALAVGTRLAEPTLAVALGYGALWLATFQFGGLRAYTNHSDYSYGIYIWGMPISQALLHFAPGLHPVSLALITAGIASMIAFLSWEAVERPALAMRHRFGAWPADGVVPSLERAAADVATGREGRPSVTAAPKALGDADRAEPAVARPWRPVSLPIRLRVANETGEASSSETTSVRVDVPTPRLSLALGRSKAGVPPIAKPANDPVGTTQGHVGQVRDTDARSEPHGPRPRSAWRPIQPPGSKPR